MGYRPAASSQACLDGFAESTRFPLGVWPDRRGSGHRPVSLFNGHDGVIRGVTIHSGHLAAIGYVHRAEHRADFPRRHAWQRHRALQGSSKLPEKSVWLRSLKEGGRATCRLGSCCAALAATSFAILPALAGTASAQAPAPASSERLSWYGDSGAPNLSGVWVRADEAGGTSDTASRSKEGWQPWPPPLTPEFAAVWQKRVADAAAGKRTDDPVRACLPPGMPRYMSGTNTPLLIIQTPGRVTQYRDGDPVRRIWLDGRPQPKPADLESFSNGTAIGRYEGQDLLTNVVGLKDEPIDSTGVPHSDDLVITERYHRLDADTLKVDVELTDLTAYAAPMKTTVTYKALNDPLWEPKEFICTPGTNYHPETYVR